MSDVEYYKKMLRSGDTSTDYSTGQFLGDQGRTQSPRKSGTSNMNKWGKTKEHVNNDWLGGSPAGKRKSWTVKKVRDIKPPEVHEADDEKKETGTTEKESDERLMESKPVVANTPEEDSKPVVTNTLVEEEESSRIESPRNTEVDPAVAKYKAMIRCKETTDYGTDDFLGEQGKSYRKSTGTLNKPKWGKARESHHDEWLGGSPTTSRKSWKVKKITDVKPPDVHNDKVEEPEEKTSSPAPTPTTSTPKSPSSPQKTEVNPTVAKYKAMLRSKETTDYGTNDFLGEQGQSYRKSTGSLHKPKWGKPKSAEQFRGEEWLGSPSSGRRPSYTIKNRIVQDVKPPTVSDDDEEEEAPKPEPIQKNTEEKPKPTPSSPEKTEDPSIAKYKAMIRSKETTDYGTTEFLGDQGRSVRKSTASPNKHKWGKPQSPDQFRSDEWLGSPSSGSGKRKSYKIKSIKATDIQPPTVHDHHGDKKDEAPKAKPSEPSSEEKDPPTPSEAEAEEKVPSAPSSPEKTEDPSIAKYKAMVRSKETTDYGTGEFLGDQGRNIRKSAASPNKHKWGKPHSPEQFRSDEWLGSPSSGSGRRKSYTIKSTKVTDIKPPTVDDEDVEKDEAPKSKPAETKAEEKVPPAPPSPEKTEDSSIAKYKAMIRSKETTDYGTGEFLGDQGRSVRNSSASPNKHKWGKPHSPEQFRSDEWLGSPSSGSGRRKSYTIKSTKVTDIKPPTVHDNDNDKKNESPKTEPAETVTEEKLTPAPSSPQPNEDPSIAKYKAMIRSKETTDYGTSEFLGDQNKAYPKTTGTLSKPKWGKTKEHINNDWIGGSPSSARRSWAVKKSPEVTVNKNHPVSSPTKAPESPAMGRTSFRDALSKFNSPGSGPTRNFRVSKEAKAMDVQAGSFRSLGDSHSTFDDSGPTLDDGQKTELGEAVTMLRKVFRRLDDREFSYGEMDKIIKKLDKVESTGGGVKPTLANVIPRLQKLVNKLFDDDQRETDEAVEKLIDINLDL